LIEASKVGIILLAAGLSTRFGDADKLLHPYRGMPLIDHAAGTAAGIGFGAHVAVVHGMSAERLPGCFDKVFNPRPEAGLSGSLGLGAASLAARDGIEACMVVLADMPLVGPDHLLALLGAFPADDPMAVLGTDMAGRTMVPAMFGKDRFTGLMALAGDRGAQSLLRGASAIACDPALLADYDEEADFPV
jgi:molybdenum cofactor cytidylyltransferase